MSVSAAVNTMAVRRWIAERLDAQKVREELQLQGCDEATIEAHLAEFKKAKHSKRQNAGFLYTAAGALLGLISCVLSLTNPVPELKTVFLYGLTSGAMVLISIGLYYIFE